MPWLENLFPSAASAFSSLFGNKKAEEGARAANAESSASVAAQMAFQERMSNTAWQRGVEDMRKAGINPLYGFTPASSPAGASYTAQNTGAAWSGLGQQMSSAVSAYNSTREITSNIERNEGEINVPGVGRVTLAKAKKLWNSASAAMKRAWVMVNPESVARIERAR